MPFAVLKTVSRHWQTSSGHVMLHDAVIHCNELAAAAAAAALLLLTSKTLAFRQHNE